MHFDKSVSCDNKQPMISDFIRIFWGLLSKHNPRGVISKKRYSFQAQHSTQHQTLRLAQITHSVFDSNS